MELQLQLTLSTGPDPNDNNLKKRCFGEAFLRVDKNDGVLSTNSSSRIDDDDDFTVGWPPVKPWRKQFLHHNSRRCAVNYVNVENSGGGGGGGGLNSKYVKVKMDGVGIVRKLDLSIHHSYQTLVANLIALFRKCQDNVEKYNLIYQNKEGDWLHAKYDLPWEIFVKSVQRLKLEKNGYGL